MFVKVFSCHRSSLEEHINEWLNNVRADTHPKITSTSIAMDEKGWVCYTIVYE